MFLAINTVVRKVWCACVCVCVESMGGGSVCGEEDKEEEIAKTV